MRPLTAHDRQVYAEVKERDQHRCQFPALDQGVPTGRKCGRSNHWAGMDCHHRKQRSAKGLTEPDNVIYLCHEHHMWCHDEIAIARDLGLIVAEGDEPERQPWMDERIPEDGFYFEDEDGAFDEPSSAMPRFREPASIPPTFEDPSDFPPW